MPSRSAVALAAAGVFVSLQALRALWRGRARGSSPASAAPSTGFEAYLKDDSVRAAGSVVNGTASEAYAATSFEAYLLNAGPARGAGAGRGSTAASRRPPPPPIARDAVPVLVLFATEFGFSREVAEEVAAALRATGRRLEPLVRDLGSLPRGWPGLAGARAAVLVSSTQGDGVPPSDARGFFAWLASDVAPRLPELSFAVAALGDRAYARFAAAGAALDARLEALGARRLCPRVDVHREDWPTIRSWAAGVADALGAAAAVGELPDVDTLGGPAGVADPAATAAAAAAAAAATATHSRGRPFRARVLAVEPLCRSPAGDEAAAAAFKQTVRVELDLGGSGLSYVPGDALGIWPENDPDVVRDALEALGASGDERVRAPAWHVRDAPADGELALRDALAGVYDLKSVRPVLLDVLRDSAFPAAGKGSATPAGAVATLTADATGVAGPTPADGGATAPAAVPSLAHLAGDPEAAEAYLEHRWVADVLRDHPAARPALEDVLRTLRQLAPRLYSISSSPEEHPTRVQATIAVVKYETLARTRGGVASTQLGERASVGDSVPVYVHENADFRLPADLSTPIVMVGPGTGIAPFRSFLVEREARAKREGATLGAATLFFGCRRRDEDFLYREQLEAWAAAGRLALRTAFSREGSEKVYVQDRVEEHGDELYALLEAGAHFYICGDGGSMAPAVERTLAGIIALREGIDVAEAAAKIERLADQGRFQRDVWVL